LDEGGFVVAEEDTFVEDDAAASFGLEAVEDMLDKQDLGRSGFVGEVSLRSPQANGSFYAIPSGDDQPPSANPQFPLSHPFDAVKL
jgi:hypothetical protein